MELRLNEGEKRLLLELLDERHKSLIHEIARTDHREFRHELQVRCGMVEDILKRIKGQDSVAA